MPYDGKDFKPTLRDLATALRDRSLWPDGFTWDYSNCRTCAMGLADRLFNLRQSDNIGALSALAKTRDVFGLSANDATDIFIDINRVNRADFPSGAVGSYLSACVAALRAVTPEMVADAIDRHLEKQGELCTV